MKTQPVKSKVQPVKKVGMVTKTTKAHTFKELRDKFGDFPDDPKKRIALREARRREMNK